jgi:predicted DCC family thiol-disulfide oxidoreductase YuxK
MTNAYHHRRPIILFDGVCNLCNASVLFILQQEREPSFQFASIQSEAGRKLLQACGLPEDDRQSVILIEQGTFYSGSTAALRIGRQLKLPWSVFSCVAWLVPRSIRDWVYRQVATHRYHWFGKRDACMVPTEELRARFL